jgi:predicted nucleic acid-binding Zn ribbon protein
MPDEPVVDPAPVPGEMAGAVPVPSADDSTPSEAAAADAASSALRRATRSTSPSTKRKSSKRRTGSQYSDARDPQPLSSALERLVEEQGWQDQSAVAVLMGEWDQIVGRDIADHVRPVSFAEGELSLEADSTAWATQLRLLLPQVHRAVDERVGTGVVTAIRVRGPQAPTWVSGPRRVKGRGPRDTYG